MTMSEEVVYVEIEAQRLPVIVHRPVGHDIKWVVVMVVGGPQYRVGSHRQFVLAARSLAEQGHAVLRFDYRGMGDAGGSARDFLDVEADITGVCQRAQELFPDSRLALYGLCDGASAIAMWLQRHTCDALILINPWVYQEHTAARTRLSSYYLQRLLSRDFWVKLLKMQVKVAESTRELSSTYQEAKSVSTTGEGTDQRYVSAMLSGLQRSPAHVQLLLSGQDLTAAEFRTLVESDKRWAKLIKSWDVRCLQHADHTFSERRDLEDAHKHVSDWLSTR